MGDNEILEVKNEINSNNLEKKMWDSKVVTSFIVAFIFVCIGFYKLFVYKNSDLGEKTNAYVGGDAYNYIINSTMGTAYFVLSLIFVVLGCTFLICNHLNCRK